MHCQMKAMEPHGELVEAARAIGICFGISFVSHQSSAFSSSLDSQLLRNHHSAISIQPHGTGDGSQEVERGAVRKSPT